VIEITTLEEAQTAEERLRKAILCKLAEIRGPWWVMINWSDSPGIERARPAKVKAAVAAALARMAVGTSSEVVVRADGVNVSLQVHPRHDQESSVVGIDSTRSARINPGEELIKHRCMEKAKRYRGLKQAGIPLIVAVCTDDFLVDEGNLFRALFGREQVTFSWKDPDEDPQAQTSGLDLSGLFTPTAAGVRYTTISEVWLVRRVGMRGRLALTIVRAPNPWAANPIDWHPRRMSVIGHTHLRRGTLFRTPKRMVRFPLDPPPRTI
jgi:hypothetical protein